MLPDGRVLLGSIDDTRTAIFHPETGAWTPGAAKADSSSEEGFTLLPDGTVLAPENSNPPYAEKYLISAGTWVSAGQTPVSLIESNFFHRDRPVPAPAGRHGLPGRSVRPHRGVPAGP